MKRFLYTVLIFLPMLVSIVGNLAGLLADIFIGFVQKKFGYTVTEGLCEVFAPVSLNFRMNLVKLK